MILAKKVTILAKYLDFANIFLKKLDIKLFKYFAIIKHLLNPNLKKKSAYDLIYNPGLIELKIFKTYIKIKLINIFI